VLRQRGTKGKVDLGPQDPPNPRRLLDGRRHACDAPPGRVLCVRRGQGSFEADAGLDHTLAFPQLAGLKAFDEVLSPEDPVLEGQIVSIIPGGVTDCHDVVAHQSLLRLDRHRQ
jgi:hypothetical protein